MQFDIWENMISLNSHEDPVKEGLEPPAAYASQGAQGVFPTDRDLSQYLRKDTYPLPLTKHREGYYGDRHFAYWASGLRDYFTLVECMEKYEQPLHRYLDLGCATGRVIRHFSCQAPHVEMTGCDINRQHVDWCATFLPRNLRVFQNTSIPSLPLSDNSIDLISAFSVFTHIEAFDTAWLMELHRVLKPGGLAWVTVVMEQTWLEITPDWPVYKIISAVPLFKQLQGNPLEQDRTIFRHRNESSYSSVVFYKRSYIERVWGRILELKEIRRRFPLYQDVVILQKNGAPNARATHQ